jgi:two-component sensor histidine kinase/DNA-binding NarL/FixJ family response regulator
MTYAPAILLVDAGTADRELIAALLQREFPTSTVSAAGDALAFADAIYTQTHDIVIVSDAVPWAGVHEIVALVRARHADAAVIVIAGRIDHPVPSLDRGIVCDAWMLKTAGGLVQLPQLVRDLLDLRPGATPAVVEPEAPSDPPSAPVEPAQVPVPAQAADAPSSVPNGTSPHVNGSAPRPSPASDTLQDVALLFSHDLREPLQQIERLVRTRSTGEPDIATATMLRRVLHCAERAHSMIDSAVEYLTLDRHEQEQRPVDLNGCLRQALENLRIEIEESHAHVRAGDLPVVLGDREQLVHLFQNLISNAIKFRGPEIPIVTIRCEERRHEYVLLFRDNGIGIPAAHAERIFGVRTRLHTSEQIPGTGLGLALCRAIVERHGGHVMLEKGETLGATFIVTLPRVAADAIDIGRHAGSASPFERAPIE